MTYQEKLLALGDEKIFSCQNCREELCKPEGRYQHGPEIAYVGEKYGLSGLPRILFTRMNPTWNSNTGWFGTRESVEEYRLQNQDADAREVFHHYLTGWNPDGKEFRGMWDAGTVTGRGNPKVGCAGTVTGDRHHNDSKREERRRHPHYGILLIMQEMIRLKVFPDSDSPLEFCAINNAVKCAGKKESYNPTGLMYKNCNWYREELQILKPHMLVAFSGATDMYLRGKNRFAVQGNQTMLLLESGECSYYHFPYPSQRARLWWKGPDVCHPDPHPDFNRKLGPMEEEQFKAGSCLAERTTSILFKYTLHLVSQAKRLKESIDA